MTDSQYLRANLLKLMAAPGLKSIPQPLEYWRRNLICVVGEVSREQTEAVLTELEGVGLITSQVDPLGTRRYWVTPAGVALAS